LAKHQFDKLFTPKETNELIPQLGVIVRQIQSLTDALRDRIAQLCRSEPALAQLPLDEIIARHPMLRQFTDKMGELASRVQGLGGFLKDIDQGLVDFPSEIEGQIVFLCWQWGESQIVAWHPIDGGFATRQPLPGAPKVYLN